ncbi:MAG: hypothetical protein ACI9X4_002460 [Glaciecola sp.]|jgi:hypothetical protein
MKPLPFLLVALSPLLMARGFALIHPQDSSPDEVLTATTENAQPLTAGNFPLPMQELAPKQVVPQVPAPELLDQPKADEVVAIAGPTTEEIKAILDPATQLQPDGQDVASAQRSGRHKNRLAGRTYAPIGVPLTQQVATGQFGVSLRVSQQQFDGLRDSRDDLSSADAFARGYAIAPTEQVDRRYELEALFGFNQRWDLYVVIPYTTHDLDQDLSLGGENNVDSSGLGDVQIGGVFRSYDRGATRLSYMAGLSLPTGEIDATDNYAGAPGTTLPYTMQLGSGTLDLLPGVLLESQLGKVRVGARAAGRIHLQGANDEDWFRGNSFRLDVWAGKELAKDLQGSLRAEANWWGDLHGSDPDMVPLRNPLEDSLRQGGSRVTLYGGLGKDLDKNGNNHLALEIGFPVEEWLDGPALSQEWSAVIGWRIKF